MSVISLVVQEGNPVTEDTIRELAQKINGGMTFKDPQDITDYKSILAAFHDSAQSILAMDDYVPPSLSPDLERYPRGEISYPKIGSSENPLGGWACKFTIKDKKNLSRKGLLEGKTVVLKDCISVAGVPCTLGTDAIQPPWVPFVDATVVTRILEAGGIIAGKATTESMCQSASSFSSSTGPVDNPYGPGRTTGGSSSGCAALIADGSVDMAIGADQGGSIRMPCAFCGLVGLKPTFGLVPYTAIASNEWQHDYAGPMAKTVADVALLLQVIAGADGLDDRAGAGSPFPTDVPPYSERLEVPNADPSAPLKGKKVGILKEAFEMPVLDPRVAEKVKEAATRFRELGAEVEEVSIPLHSIAPTAWMTANRCVGGRTRLGHQAGHRQYYQNDLHNAIYPMKQEVWEKFIPATINSMLNCLYVWDNMPGLYGKAMNKTMEISHAYDMALAKYDCLVLPTVAFVANTHPSPDATALQKIMKSVGQGLNCCPFNGTGHPALSLPIGTLPPAKEDWLTETDGELQLPVGMQLVGKWWNEEGLFQLANAWEKKYDWKSL
ncbi:amidase signature enzyme [Crucibulum laeve]|uniref:Amidase signature enzyme n=1 Tax=Crucibulum laeve TaxID=68775 RepID=A0A5C3M105_9AGAR|nr:amidase signature enzyme [Crucibulum laeve]